MEPRHSYHRWQVDDRVKVEDSPWVSDDNAGEIVEVTEHDKPKGLTYHVRLDDGSETKAREEHLRPAYSFRDTNFGFEIGAEVNTPVGVGKIRDRAITPLGNLYRVSMDSGDGGTRDFLERELIALHAYARTTTT